MAITSDELLREQGFSVNQNMSVMLTAEAAEMVRGIVPAAHPLTELEPGQPFTAPIRWDDRGWLEVVLDYATQEGLLDFLWRPLLSPHSIVAVSGHITGSSAGRVVRLR